MINLKNINKIFGDKDNATQVLKNVSLNINKGEFVAIIGQSGSGKSTLMNIIGCLDTASSGEYILNGANTGHLDSQELSGLRLKTFGFIFQRYNLLSSSNATANVALPGIYASMDKNARESRAKELLNRLGLSDKHTSMPNQLSGGQQQRVSIARALMNGGEILLCDEPTGALDSKSGETVMQILKELHASGHTIIIVTHDPKIAAYADRIIEIKDGEIIKDESKTANSVATLKPKPSQSLSLLGSINAYKERVIECFMMSLHSIKSHKLRSFLTMLGIIIGIASVICVIALGRGTQEKILAEINKIGTATISFHLGKAPGDPNRHSIAQFSISDTELLNTVNFIDYATPTIDTAGLLVKDNKEVSANLRAGNEHMLAITGATIDSGRDLNKNDIASAASVILIDTDVQKEFFGGADPLGQTILFNRRPFTIVGVVKKDDNKWSSENLTVYAPYTTAVYKLTGDTNLRNFTVKLNPDIDPQFAEHTITQIMIARRGERDFHTRNSDTILQTIKSTTDSMRLLISGIALIALIVGGIGVMNIMLVSVIERTKEIGLRMAIGAGAGDIMMQFLLEAVMLCIIGGAAGIMLAFSLGYALQSISGGTIAVIFSTGSVILALCVSTGIGIIFGFIPARNAAKLNPIDALLRE